MSDWLRRPHPQNLRPDLGSLGLAAWSVLVIGPEYINTQEQAIDDARGAIAI